MATNTKVFEAEIDLKLKNAQNIAAITKRIENLKKTLGTVNTIGIKKLNVELNNISKQDIGKSITRISKNFEQFGVSVSKTKVSLEKTKVAFEKTNNEFVRFRATLSKNTEATTKNFKEFDAVMTSLFARIPQKMDANVILLKRRYRDLFGETERMTKLMIKYQQQYDAIMSGQATAGSRIAELEAEKLRLQSSKRFKSESSRAKAVGAVDKQLSQESLIFNTLKEESFKIDQAIAKETKNQVKSMDDLVHTVSVNNDQLEEIRDVTVKITDEMVKQNELQRTAKSELREQLELKKKALKEELKSQEQQLKIAEAQQAFDANAAKRASLRTQGARGILGSGREAVTGIRETLSKKREVKGLRDVLGVGFDILGELNNVTQSFQKNAKDITSGMDLIASKGNVFVGLRRAIYGSEEATGRLGKGLEYLISTTTSFDRNQNKLQLQAAENLKAAREYSQFTRKMVDDVKSQGVALGVSATKFTSLNTTMTQSVHLMKRLEANFRSGEQVGKNQVLQIQNHITAVDTLDKEYEPLIEDLVTVKKIGVDSTVVKNLQMARDQIRMNRQALQEAAQASQIKSPTAGMSLIGKAKDWIISLANPLTKVKEESKKAQEGIYGLSGTMDESAKKAGLLGQSVEKSMKVAISAIDMVKMAFVNAFLGPIFSSVLDAVGKFFRIITTPITLPFEAILAPFKMLSGLIDTLTGQVQQFFASLPQQFMQANKLQQDFTTTLTQMMAGYDKETIKKSVTGAMDFLSDVIAKTPFEMPTGQAAFQQLVTAGFDPEKWLMPAADAAAAMNKEMGWFVNALQRLKAGSKGMAVDMLRDFGIAVQQVGVWTDSTGKAIDKNKLFIDGVKQTDEQLKQSGNTFKQWKFDAAGSLEQTPTEALDILNGYLQQNAVFAGASAARSKTLGGVMSNLNDLVTKLLTTLGSPIFSGFTKILTDIYNVADKVVTAITPFMTLFGEELSRSMSSLWESITGISQAVDEFGEPLAEASTRIEDISNSILSALKPALNIILALVKGDFPKAWGLFLKYAKDAISWLAKFLKTTGKDAFKWGVDLIKQIAKGITSAAKTVIKSAVSLVGKTISSFLQPHSPPDEGPLSTIDEWGKKLVEVFGSSFTEADFSFITDALSSVREMFSGDIYKQVRGSMMDIVKGINETGTINEQLWDSVAQKLGGVNSELAKFVRAELELKKVTKEYDDATKAGFVSKELQDRLEATKAMVALQKDNLDLQQQQAQQIQQNQDTNPDGTPSDSGMPTQEDIQKEYAENRKKIEKQYKVGIINKQEYYAALSDLDKNYAQSLLDIGNEEGAKNRMGIVKQENLASIKESLKQEQAYLEKKKKLGLITQEEFLQQTQDLNKSYAEQLLQAGDEAGAKELADRAKAMQAEIDKAALAQQQKDMEKQLQQELKILEKKKELGLITEQEYQEARLQLYQGYAENMLQLDPSGKSAQKALDIIKGLKEEYKKLTEIKMDDPAATLAGFGEEVSGQLDGAIADIQAEFGNLATTTWDDFTKTFDEAIGGIWEDLKTAFSDPNQVLSEESSVSWQQRIREFLFGTEEGGGVFSDLSVFFDNVINGFNTWSEENKPALSDAGKNVGTAIVDGIIFAVSALFSEKSPQLVSDVVSKLLNVTYWVQGVESAISGGLFSSVFGERVGKAIGDAFFPLGNKAVQEFLNGILETMGTIDWMQVFTNNLNPIVPFLELWGLDIKGIFQKLYDTLVGHSIVPDLINEIVALFTGLPEQITSLDIVGQLLTPFQNLATDMFNLGTGFIQSFIDGITGIIPTLQETMNTVTTEVAAWWPHSPAEKGPLSVPINFTSYLNDPLGAALGVVQQNLNQFSTAATTTLNGVVQATAQATSAISNATRSVGSGFGNYGRGSSSGPNIAQQGGIAASWQRFFQQLRGGGVGSTYAQANHSSVNAQGQYVGSYASGTPSIPSDGFAQVHKGEMIIPANLAEKIRNSGSQTLINRLGLSIADDVNQLYQTVSDGVITAVKPVMTVVDDIKRLTVEQIKAGEGTNNRNVAVDSAGQLIMAFQKGGVSAPPATMAGTNRVSGTVNNFNANSFNGAFPNVRDARDAKNFLAALEEMIKMGELKGSLV